MDPEQEDPQSLLASLAAEYNRSKRFLEQLESSFLKEPPSAPLLGLSRAPAGNAESNVEEAVNSAAAPCQPPAAQQQQQQQSADLKLRDKLRSFFSRRAMVRKATSSGSEFATVGRTVSESQSSTSSRNLTSRTAAGLSELPVTAVSVSPPAARRSPQVYFTTHIADVPREAMDPTDGALRRPTTANRRTSVVYFGGEAVDSASQGWVARVGGGGSETNRPATAGRRPSLVYAATGAADAATETDKGCFLTSAESATSPSERSATVRRVSFVLLGGDALAAAGSGRGGGGTRGGVLQHTTDPHEFMSVAAGTRRTASFQQRSRTALQPTAQRLRSGRRASVDSYISREVLSQHYPAAPHPSTSPPPPPGLAPSSPPPQQHHHYLSQLEARPLRALPQHQVAAAPPGGRRASSMEIPRPFSAAPVRHHYPAAAAAAATAAGAPVNISNSALFTTPSHAPAFSTLTATATATVSVAGRRVEAPPPQPSPVLSPAPAPATTTAAAAVGLRLRVQQNHEGMAWAPLAVPSLTNSPVAGSPASPPGAVQGSEGTRSAGAGAAVLRSAMSTSSKWPSGKAEGTQAAVTAAAVAPWAAARASPRGGGAADTAAEDAPPANASVLMDSASGALRGSAVLHVTFGGAEDVIASAAPSPLPSPTDVPEPGSGCAALTPPATPHRCTPQHTPQPPLQPKSHSPPSALTASWWRNSGKLLTSDGTLRSGGGGGATAPIVRTESPLDSSVPME